MQADSGRKYRAYPTSEQAVRLASWGHTCRWLYNTALTQRDHRAQKSTTWRIGLNAQCVHLTQARREIDWVKDLPAQCGQQVLRHLDRGFRNWWDPAHPAQRPTHKRRTSALAVPFPGQAVTVRRLSRRWGAVTLPKLGDLRFRWSRPLGGTIRNASVSFDGTGWHVSFGVATGQRPAARHAVPTSSVGIDRGVKAALALSDGRLWNQTFRSTGQQAQLARLKSKAGRQETRRRRTGAKTSQRALRVRAAINRAEAGIRARRQDYAHWAANRICAQYALVGVEELRIKNMTKSAKGTLDEPGTNVAQKSGLNRSILDKGWYTFELALHNQARRTATRIVKVPAAYTSQRCSACKFTHPDSRKSQAVFRCVACGFTCHADLNAAINIREAAEAASGFTRGALGDAARKAPRRPPSRHRRKAAPDTGIAVL